MLALLVVMPARASSDLCGGEWALDLATRDECRNVAALGPGNDTRVNLLLLLHDRHGVPAKPQDPAASPVLQWREFRDVFAPAKEGGLGKDQEVAGFAAGEGSRCRSNEGGAAAFVAAVKAAEGLAAAERDALLRAREDLKAACAPGKDAAAPRADASFDELIRRMGSRSAKAFATYLHGTAAFYGDRLNDAADDFALARNAPDPWLADAAGYMVARTEVNRMQAGAFDAYGTFAGSDHVSQQAASAAEASLHGYLDAHPAGRFVGSARGLLRRVAWLAGWTDKLAEQYAALLAKPAADRGIDDLALIEEIDNKLLPTLKPEMTTDPTLLAVLDLRGMRRPGDAKGDDWRKAAVSRSDLDAQRAAFGSAVPLWEFLSAADAFYVEGASEPVVKGIRDETRRRDGDDLWFSRQLLRGVALEARNDRNARGFWKELAPGAARPFQHATVELALALHDGDRGDVADVFAPGSPVRNAAMRNILAEHLADPPLLRALARDASLGQRERDVALFTLLYKELTRGFYAEFLSDVAAVAPDAPVDGPPTPDPADGPVRLGVFTRSDKAGDIGCPTLRITVARLAGSPDSQRDRLCLAEFVRVNELDDNALDATPAKGQLGGSPSQFPRRPYSRTATYRAIIADRGARAEDRGYALYRAVRCYEPTGNNGCGAPAVPKAERKAWYFQLKRDYPASRWARDLPYWW